MDPNETVNPSDPGKELNGWGAAQKTSALSMEGECQRFNKRNVSRCVDHDSIEIVLGRNKPRSGVG
jgi:hypothetical protein